MSEKIKRRIAQQLNFLNDDVVEIARPSSTILRIINYAMMFIILVFAIVDFSTPLHNHDPMRDRFDALFNPEKLDQRNYKKYISFPLYKKAELEQKIKEGGFTYTIEKDAVEKELAELKIPTLEEYKKQYPDRNERDRFWGVIYYILPFVFIFFILFIPESRPIRVDRKNGVIYFKSWCNYFLYRIPQDYFNPENSNTRYIDLIDILPLEFNIGKLEGGFIALYSADYKSIITREVLVGKSEDEKEELKAFLVNFISYKECAEFKEYAKKKALCKRILSFSFFSLGYHEKKTEAFIQNYFEKYGHLVLTEQKTKKVGKESFMIFGGSGFSPLFTNESDSIYIETVRTAEEEKLWQRLQKALKRRVLRRFIIMGILAVLGAVARSRNIRGG